MTAVDIVAKALADFAVDVLASYDVATADCHTDPEFHEVCRESAVFLCAKLRALPTVQPEPAPEHFDDYAVRSFAKMMSEKMALSRAKGRSGWNDPEQCSVEYLRHLLYEHLAKGDPVDVANICMMLRHYEASTAPEPAPALGAEWMRQEAVAKAEQWNQHYRCAGGFHNHAVAAKVVRDEIDAIPAPTHEQMLADALALEEVRAVVEACRDVIAEREIDGQGDCGCDMCMAVDRMTITLAKLKGGA